MSLCFYPLSSLPGGSDPCFANSKKPQGSDNPFLNPCGRFTCHPDSSDPTTNTCDCQLPFVQVTNDDGSRTCAYGEIISQREMNHVVVCTAHCAAER